MKEKKFYEKKNKLSWFAAIIDSRDVRREGKGTVKYV